MVKLARRTAWVCLLALPWLPLAAKDLADYRAGDVAGSDLATPMALDVIDPAATAALKASEALKVPSVFRSFPDVTNEMTRDFLAAFASARSNFTAAVAGEFNSPKVDDATVASEDFGYLITAFNVRHKAFPVTSELAAEWARGHDGRDIRERILGRLQQATRRPLRPDALPDGFVIGEDLRLVAVSDVNQKLTLNDAQNGKLATATSMTTVTRAQGLFRREFSAEDQPFARAMAAFIKPSCMPDAALTRLARAEAVRDMVVAEHFNAGQIIVHRGETIDAREQIALDALNEKLMPGLLNQQIAAERARAQQEQEQAQLARVQAMQASNAAQEARNTAEQLRSESKSAAEQALRIHQRNEWLLAALVVVFTAVFAVLWRVMARRSRVAPVQPLPVVQVSRPVPDLESIQSELAPQVAQAVREAVMQELALQRRELMVAQQAATDEIIALVQRLDELQLPLQERLRAYETQIKKLEKELAVRAEENRELLKLKIDMMRRQLEIERARTWTEWTDFNN